MAYWVPLADTASHTFTKGVLQIRVTLLHCSSSCLQETASEQRQKVGGKNQTQAMQAPAALLSCTEFLPHKLLCHCMLK
jgi:hypothetical protein